VACWEEKDHRAISGRAALSPATGRTGCHSEPASSPGRPRSSLERVAPHARRRPGGPGGPRCTAPGDLQACLQAKMLAFGGPQRELVGPSHATASCWWPMYRRTVASETYPTEAATYHFDHRTRRCPSHANSARSTRDVRPVNFRATSAGESAGWTTALSRAFQVPATSPPGGMRTGRRSPAGDRPRSEPVVRCWRR